MERKIQNGWVVTLSFVAILTIQSCARQLRTYESGIPCLRGNWTSVETGHFSVYSALPETETERIGANLERLLPELTILCQPSEVDSLSPISILIFDDTSAFEWYRPYESRECGRISGYFFAWSDGIWFAVDGSAQAARSVNRVFTDYFLSKNRPDTPLWLNIGLAEYYSTFRSDSSWVEIGRPHKGHLYLLGQTTLIPVRRLLSITRESREYNSKFKRGVIHAESWALVHYLLSRDREQIRQIARFLNLLSKRKPTEGLFYEIFRRDYSSLERELCEYIQEPKLSYIKMPFDTLPLDTSARIRPMRDEEVLLQLGNLLAHDGEDRWAEAEAHFREAIKVDSSYASGYAALGFLRSRQGENDEALEYFRKALNLNSNDCWTQFHYGSCLMKTVETDFFELKPLSETTYRTVAEARRAFQKAGGLDSNLVEAKVKLGMICVRDSSVAVDEGIEALETAMKRLPSRIDVAVNLLALYVRRGERSKAQVLLQNVIRPRADSRTLGRAQDIFVRGEIQRATTLINEDKIDAAIHMLEEARALADDEDLLEQIEELYRVAEYNREVEKYNEAIARARAEDFKEAARLLEEVIAANKDPNLVQDAKDALAQVGKVLARQARGKKGAKE